MSIAVTEEQFAHVLRAFVCVHINVAWIIARTYQCGMNNSGITVSLPKQVLSARLSHRDGSFPRNHGLVAGNLTRRSRLTHLCWPVASWPSLASQPPHTQVGRVQYGSTHSKRFLLSDCSSFSYASVRQESAMSTVRCSFLYHIFCRSAT